MRKRPILRFLAPCFQHLGAFAIQSSLSVFSVLVGPALSEPASRHNGQHCSGFEFPAFRTLPESYTPQDP